MRHTVTLLAGAALSTLIAVPVAPKPTAHADELNRTMVAEMAENWDVLRGPGCAADLDDAEQSVVSHGLLDPRYQRALTFATRSYCG